MQEVLRHQLIDLLSSLNAPTFFHPPPVTDPQVQANDGLARPEWDHVGVGRDDGNQAGEYVPIFYRPRIWELREHGTEWLSEKPKEKGWDAGSKRIVTIAILAHRATGKELLIMNTHLDNEGVVARRESAKLLVTLAEKWSRQDTRKGVKGRDCPFVLTGDLNSNKDGEAYQILEAELGYDVGQRCEKDISPALALQAKVPMLQHSRL